MEVHQIRYFCAVARCCSFTRAALREHVSQPTLSHQVLKLEDELGAKLFCRAGRSVSLTALGETFLPRAENILLQIREARREIQEVAGRVAGSITLGMIPSLAPMLVSHLVGGFIEQNPVIEMRVIEESSSTLTKLLHEEKIDAAVMLPITAEWASWLELVHEKLYVVVGPEHSLRGEKELALERLESAPFLLLKDSHSFRNGALAAFHAANVKPRIVFETGSFMTILRMVKAGIGISVVPEMAVDATSGCTFVPVKADSPFRIIGLVHSKRRLQTRPLRLFLEYAQNLLNRQPGAQAFMKQHQKFPSGSMLLIGDAGAAVDERSRKSSVSSDVSNGSKEQVELA